MAKHLPFSAPQRKSLPTVNNDTASILQNWKTKLSPVIKRSLPSRTPSNFAVTNSRGGLKLTWSPVQTPEDKALGSPDGYEILKSASGTFTSDLVIIPLKGANVSEYFDSLGGSAQTASYRIRTTSGTANNPQSQRGPESGVVSHTSLDTADTTSVATTIKDTFTNDKTRALARLGNYGAIKNSNAGIGTTSAATGAVSSAPVSAGGAPQNTPAAAVLFSNIGSGTNNSAQMVVGLTASITPDPNNPGVISATHLQGTLITTSAPANKNGLRYNSTNLDLEYSPTPVTAGPTAHQFLTAYDETTGSFTLAQPTEADLSLSDITTNNVSSLAHGLAPKSPSDATKFLNGAATPTYAQVKDSDLSLSNITTNNVSVSAHGFAPQLPNDPTKYLDGTGNWSTSRGGGVELISSFGRLLLPIEQTLTTSSNYTTNALAANDVWGFEFEVNKQITIGHAYIYVAVTPGTGSNFYVGILDSTGTVLWQAKFATPAAAGVVAGTISPGSFTLTPGSYYWVFGSDLSSASFTVLGAGIATNLELLLNAGSAKRSWFATAGPPISGGALQNVSLAGVTVTTNSGSGPSSIPWCMVTT